MSGTTAGYPRLGLVWLSIQHPVEVVDKPLTETALISSSLAIPTILIIPESTSILIHLYSVFEASNTVGEQFCICKQHY